MTVPSHDRLTMAEATAYTGCSERTLRRYVSAGRLPAYRVGPRRLVFHLADLDGLLQRVPTVSSVEFGRRTR
ncbi:MAG: helix-turn-helix transcriptional regulator [Sporichthyaceae bacterium]